MLYVIATLLSLESLVVSMCFLVFAWDLYPSREGDAKDAEIKRNNDFIIQEKSNFGSSNFIPRVLPEQPISSPGSKDEFLIYHGNRVK